MGASTLHNPSALQTPRLFEHVTPKMKDLKGKIVRGGFMRACAQAAQILLRAGTLVIFARLLDPKDFGLVGMVTAITGVLSLFKDFGLSTVTIQRSAITDEQISTLFWLNLLVGGILTCLTWTIAPALVAFYHEPRLFWVTIALAFGFLFNAAGVQHSALLQRHMRFVTLGLIEIVSLLTSTLIGLGIALRGLRYWALVGWSLALPASNAVGVWLASRWTPGGPRRVPEVLSMIRFGGTITINGLIIYIAYNLDKILLGRFYGADALGIYGRAYQMADMPQSAVGAVGTIMFSALSRVQNDPPLIRSYFLKGYNIILAVTLPMVTLCALFTEELIQLLFGPKWVETIVIFRLLIPATFVLVLISPFGWFLWSIGRPGRNLKIALVIMPLVIAGYVMGLPFGPNGVALGFSAMMMLWLVPHILWSTHETMISPRDIWHAVRKPFLSAIIAAGLAIAVLFLFRQFLSPLVRLLLGGSVLVGSYSYVLMWVMGQKSFYLDLFLILTSFSSPKRGESETLDRPTRGSVSATILQDTERHRR